MHGGCPKCQDPSTVFGDSHGLQLDLRVQDWREVLSRFRANKLEEDLKTTWGTHQDTASTHTHNKTIDEAVSEAAEAQGKVVAVESHIRQLADAETSTRLLRLAKEAKVERRSAKEWMEEAESTEARAAWAESHCEKLSGFRCRNQGTIEAMAAEQAAAEERAARAERLLAEFLKNTGAEAEGPVIVKPTTTHEAVVAPTTQVIVGSESPFTEARPGEPGPYCEKLVFSRGKAAAQERSAVAKRALAEICATTDVEVVERAPAKRTDEESWDRRNEVTSAQLESTLTSEKNEEHKVAAAEPQRLEGFEEATTAALAATVPGMTGHKCVPSYLDDQTEVQPTQAVAAGLPGVDAEGLEAEMATVADGIGDGLQCSPKIVAKSHRRTISGIWTSGIHLLKGGREAVRSNHLVLPAMHWVFVVSLFLRDRGHTICV
eukprot:TRINITY_DN56847_c0_g1_i1.p1 TRINITY_DN56847_c0_g1~~TRINITY_DN56847_c0_g1_i1.p1  ORF type:complete len:433 (-),score=66.97 TRINITY_DN56847_c0_g1_i1:94-1392(-)